VLWGSELSPFALKVEAMLRFRAVPYHWMPASGGVRAAQRLAGRLRRVKSGQLPLSWPRMTELDELPQVPFLLGPTGENLYDSSAIGAWLDRPGSPARAGSTLTPDEDPALRFCVRLVDEALDEIGLYLVHHNRWVVSARDNDAGERLAREMRPLLGPLAAGLRRRFPARQVRRLPYLFSVAPDATESRDLPRRLRPPRRSGFPPTHALLEQLFADLLSAVEPILAQRPFLFGERFTLADASLYGQLGMNRTDPSARDWIQRDAPATHAWIERLAVGDFTGHRDGARPVLDAACEPLLAWVCRGFVPLMRQNREAFERCRNSGETRFNERAFDAGRALYDGTLAGHPFRSVVKSFQVRVWRDLRGDWERLPAGDLMRLEAALPAGHGLDREGVGSGASA